jgi:hypothetical protein
MPCNHKFYVDLQLQYVNWEPTTLFIGTFNPEWQICGNNNAEWFYGRTNRNEFWCVLPRVFGQDSLLNENNRLTWIDFCRKNNIAITDILSCIDADITNPAHVDMVCNFSDDKIEDFCVTVNNIPAILDNFQSIRQICITRQTLTPFWNACFQSTSQYIALHPERGINLIRLRSPSRGAIRGVLGNFCQFVSARWIQQGFNCNP